MTKEQLEAATQRLARAVLDGDATAPMILQDAATLAAIVITYTEDERQAS